MKRDQEKKVRAARKKAIVQQIQTETPPAYNDQVAAPISQVFFFFFFFFFFSIFFLLFSINNNRMFLMELETLGCNWTLIIKLAILMTSKRLVFCFVLFCFVLFCFVLFCFVLFCF